MESSLQALGFVWELPLPWNICSSRRKRNVQLDLRQRLCSPGLRWGWRKPCLRVQSGGICLLTFNGGS